MPGLLNNRRWEVLPSNKGSERALCEQLGIAPLVSRVLCARGISDAADAYAFLHPSLDRDWADPLDIPGMREAADRVEAALREGERMAVFGDFDVDGMTSTCLLTQALRVFGGDVHPYIPHRFGEGYGLSREALTRVINDSSPQLIITVDNGISSGNEVAWLLERGIDVVVTDHHEPGDLVPQHVPVTDPKLEVDCYSRELAGAGVALKLVCELGKRLGKPDLWRAYTDLAAMGTVSDMMVLQGENRSLVADGIERMRHSQRPGIVALAATAHIDLADVHADDLPFSLIPRLNAAGRMGTTEVAFDLLIASSQSEAASLAGMLEKTNTERRETESALSEEALERLSSSYGGERVIVLAGEGWHEGVKGIVASRVVNAYHVPTIIFTVSDGIARGSGRSVGSVDLFHAVEQCSDLLVRFGGHAGAVGVTCEVNQIDAFRERLQHVLEELPEEQFVDKGEVSALVSLPELTLDNINSLEVLQPFGQGNKRPNFGVRGVFMQNRARVGYDGNHLRFTATDGVASVPAIMFRAPEIDRAIACERLVDLVVDAINETWQGRVNPKLMVRDILYRDEREARAGEADHPTQNEQPSVYEQERPQADRSMRAELKRLSPAGLTERLRQAMIGSHDLLPAQSEALSRLADGRSTLCVMATGRGKSLVFHLHAARMALLENKASVFVYPLRALVSDQAFHLSESLGALGLRVCTLTGETSLQERKSVHDGLINGTVDIVLTTPEYLAIHTADFSRSKRVGFLVVDEAHHAGTAKSGDRAAYGELDRVIADLGRPVALAVTATAATPVSREICRMLDIRDEDVVIDRTVRENLRLDDCRDLAERDKTLASLVARGEADDKTVVYVNSRSEAAALARMLRNSIPEMGHRIAFYHAGLPRTTRLRVERAFRDGRLSCVVSTSAFGEGVNLPGIRNVVLYHMPFGATEFNQMSGRAGRDGREAHVYLLYGSRDARINEGILRSAAPSRTDLATLYRALMTEDRQLDGGDITLGTDKILSVAQGIDSATGLSEAGVTAGIAIFEELGLCHVEGFGDDRRLHMVHSPAHVDLESSLRYTEGVHALEEFESFRAWALESLPAEMLSRMNRPIAPGYGQTVDR